MKTFENTEDRVDFIDLVKDLDKEKEERQKIKNTAIRLYREGKTCEQISLELTEQGYKNCGRSTVGKWIKGSGRPSIQKP